MPCLKPSGLIDWVSCRLSNGCVHIKCANLSKTEAWSLAKFNCCRCSLVNTIPECHDDNFRPHTFFNSGVIHLKRFPKKSRISLAENLIPKIIYICETPSKIALWCLFLSSLSCFFWKNHLEEVNVSANINKLVRDGVIEKRPKRDRKPQQKNELVRRLLWRTIIDC